MREREREGKEIAVLAQVNRNLPFMFGDAMVPPETFDFVVDRPELELPLFAPPNEPIDTTDYLIATHVSALIRDGGTLQVGIGSLGDAIVRLLQVRHEDNGVYREVLDALDVPGRCGDLIERWGGTGPFERGLYAATEMLVDGFLALYRSGILKRRVYPHAALQRLLDAGRLPVDRLTHGRRGAGRGLRGVRRDPGGGGRRGRAGGARSPGRARQASARADAWPTPASSSGRRASTRACAPCRGPSAS